MASDPFHDMLKDILGVVGHIVWELGLLIVPFVAFLYGGIYMGGAAFVAWALMPGLIWGVRYLRRNRE